MVKWDFFSKIFLQHDLSKMGISNISSQIIYGLFWIFIANIMSVEDYGELSYLVAIGTITSTLCLIGGPQTFTVFAAKGLKLQRPLVTISLLLSIGASLAVFAIVSNISIMVFIIGTVIFTIISSELLGLKLYGQFSKNIFFQRILSICLAILFYYVLGYPGIILGIGISYFVFIKRVILILKTYPVNYSLIKPKNKFIFSSYGVDVSKIFALQLDKIFIMPIFGTEILGSYYLGIQILAIGIALPGTIFQYLVPKESSGEQVKKMKIMNVIFSLAIVGLGFLLIPLLFPILFPDYVDSSTMIQIMIISLIPTTINLMYSSKFYAIEKSNFIFIGSIISILIQIPLLIILGTMWQGVGLATALILAYSGESIYFFIVDKTVKHNEYSNNT